VDRAGQTIANARAHDIWAYLTSATAPAGASGRTSSLFELAVVLVRLDHVASRIVKAEPQHHVNGCETSRSRLRC
jgi:hypothetical protein